MDTDHLDFPEFWVLALFEGMAAWILNNFAVIRRWVTAYTTELASDDGDYGYFCENVPASEM